MLIDAHVHFVPPELAADLPGLAGREPYWGLLLDPPHGRSIQGYASAERMVADMDAAGVDRVLLVGEYFRRHDSCVARNDQAIDLVRGYPDRIAALAVVQPTAGPKAVDELKRCLDAGLVGMGELNPYAQGFRLNGRAFEQLAAVCIAADLPVNLHVSEEVGGYYLGKSTTPLRHYYDLAVRMPALKLILAHWGGGLLFYEMMPRVRKQLRHVWYDTAASPLLYPTAKIFNAALACVPAEKILFGSDYPLRIYPRRMREPDMRPFIDEIAAVGGLSNAQRAAIMGGNAQRLFGWGDTDRSADRNPIPPNKKVPPPAPAEVSGQTAVSLIAQRWPETQKILARHGIPWRDDPVPQWEPVAQAAVARGMTPTQVQHLIDELNTVIH